MQAGTLHDYVMYGDRASNAVFYELTRYTPDTATSSHHRDHVVPPEGTAAGDAAARMP